MAEAQARWPVLTHFDASTIKNDRQIAPMEQERCSLTQEAAENDARIWMDGKVL